MLKVNNLSSLVVFLYAFSQQFALMTSDNNRNQQLNPPHGGLTAQNDDPGNQQQRHSGPATPKRPSAMASTSTRPTRGVKSTPSIGSTRVNSNSKVAIPRQSTGYTPRYNRRVPRACESCRQRKTKCSGDTPVCRQCRELRVPCQYPMGWRDKMKRLWTMPLSLSKLGNYRFPPR